MRAIVRHIKWLEFQLTAARRRLVFIVLHPFRIGACFNSQPPEGGWSRVSCSAAASMGFNSQPPEGGWEGFYFLPACHVAFQLTAARRRLVKMVMKELWQFGVSTHSRPKAAGALIPMLYRHKTVSTHSRPKAAGTWRYISGLLSAVSTHSRPKAAGFYAAQEHCCICRFQLTAARRRLVRIK